VTVPIRPEPNALKAFLRRLTSLQPHEQTGAETVADIGMGFVPGVGQAQAVRDFVRSLKGDDRLGMGLAMAGMIPVAGGMAKAAGKVDDAAKMWRAFHGTPREAFESFDRLAGNLAKEGTGNVDQIGHWFASRPSAARRYAGSQGNIADAEIRMRNPLTLTGRRGWDEMMALWKESGAADNLPAPTPGFRRPAGAGDPEKLRALLKQRGHDGVVIDAANEIDDFGIGDWQMVVPLDPEQIKINRWFK
jgi:hypothetical protein